MQEALPGYLQKRAIQLTPERSALLILDMQKYFLDARSHAYIPSAPAILPGLKRLVEAYSRRGRPVFFTQHCNTLQDAGMMARWWRELITDSGPFSEISDAFDLSRGTLIRKNQYDAFYHTDLEDLLRQLAILQVVICGVMTHLCCETTARSAFVRGFEVFFTVDGTATYNQDFQMATLLNLSHGVATPILVGEILAAFGVEDGS